jgi:hypothetical protein
MFNKMSDKAKPSSDNSKKDTKSGSNLDIKAQLESDAQKIITDIEGLLRNQVQTNASTNGGNQVPPSSSSKVSSSVVSAEKKSSKRRFQLNELTVLRTLGTGSFGRVHLIQHKSSSQYLAMKVMKKAEIVRLKQVEHTVNEKKILDTVEFPFLVNMLGFFQDSYNLYFIMEYVQGGELFSLLRREQVCFDVWVKAD